MELKELGLKEIYLDLNNDLIGSFFAKEGELNSRGLIINILKNGVVANTTGIDIFMYALASDKKVYEKKADEIDISKGKYELIYPANMLKAGKTKVELRLKKGISNIATKTFILDVDKAIVSDDLIEGVDELSLIEKLLEAGRNEEERIANEGIRIASEEDRGLAENERVSSEIVRKENEVKRESNEDVRKFNEITRKEEENERSSNELNRKEKETIRVSSEVDRKSEENKRVFNETARKSNEDERITNETDRKLKENERVASEKTRVIKESERNTNELQRETNENVRKTNEIDRIEQYDLVNQKLADGEFKGDKGEQGDGLNILGKLENEADLPLQGKPGDAYLIDGELWVWEGTHFINVGSIKGERGDDGKDGINGKDAVLTNESVITAIGYTPLKIDDIDDKVDKVSGKGLSANDYSDEEKQKVVDNKANLDSHVAEDATQAHLAKNIGLEDAEDNFVATNVEGAMSELFTSVSSGKGLIATAITDKGVPTSSSDSFSQMADKIDEISTGGEWAEGTTRDLLGRGDSETIYNLGFEPSVVMVVADFYFSGTFNQIVTSMSFATKIDGIEIWEQLFPMGGNAAPAVRELPSNGNFTIAISSSASTAVGYKNIKWIAYS